MNNNKDDTGGFPFTRRKLCSLILIIGLLCSAFFAGQAVGQSGIGNQNYPTAYNSGGPTGAYDYLIFTFENSTGTYYAAKDSFGRIVDSWTSTNYDSVLANCVNVLPDGSGLITDTVNGVYQRVYLHGVEVSNYGVDETATFDLPDFQAYTIPTKGIQGWHSWASVIYNPDVKKIFVIYRDGPIHSYSANTTVRSIESCDGVTWENDKEIQSVIAGADLIPYQAIMMDNGRMGIICNVRTGSDTYEDPLFLYSDDDGDTWSSTQLSVGGLNYITISNIIRYPSSVGGNDTGGFMFFRHTSTPTGKSIRAVSTVDNGATWIDRGDILSRVGSEQFTEPTITRIGALDKWVMVIRDNSATSTNALVSKSTDLLNWSYPEETNLLMGKNRPHMWYQNGSIHLMAGLRSTMVDIASGYVGLTSMPALQVWNNPTNWQSWEYVCPVGEGYPVSTELGSQRIIVLSRKIGNLDILVPKYLDSDYFQLNAAETDTLYINGHKVVDGVLDDFETGFINNTHYYINRGRFAFSRSPVLQGTYSLRNHWQIHNNLITDYDVLRGWRYTQYIYFDALTDDTIHDQSFSLDFSDSKIDRYADDGYSVTIQRGSTLKIDLLRRDDGVVHTLDSNDSLTIPTGEWLKLDVSLGFSKIIVNLEQLDGTPIVYLEANDDTYTSGLLYKIQLLSTEPNKYVYMDYVLRTPL